MAALIERSYRAGFMPASRRTSIYRMFSARGWRTTEPFSDEIPRETPELAGVIASSLINRGLSPEEIAHIAGFANAADNHLIQRRGLRLA